MIDQREWLERLKRIRTQQCIGRKDRMDLIDSLRNWRSAPLCLRMIIVLWQTPAVMEGKSCLPNDVVSAVRMNGYQQYLDMRELCSRKNSCWNCSSRARILYVIYLDCGQLCYDGMGRERERDGSGSFLFHGVWMFCLSGCGCLELLRDETFARPKSGNKGERIINNDHPSEARKSHFFMPNGVPEDRS